MHTGMARIGDPFVAPTRLAQRLDVCRTAAACAAGAVRTLCEQRAAAPTAPAASHRRLPATPAHQPASKSQSGLVALLSMGMRPAGSAPAPILAASTGWSVGAAAAAGVLTCLPYELPALRAVPLDTDPAQPGPFRAWAVPAASRAPQRLTPPPGVWMGHTSLLAAGK